MRHGVFCATGAIAAFLILVSAANSFAQQGTSFTYQGRLTENGTGATGTYDFDFRLFTSGGVQLGSAFVAEDVPVANGVFTVRLNFGADHFASGAASELEVRVRPGGSTGGFQQLLPRHFLDGTPYAIRSLSAFSADSATTATQLGGVAANQFVLTSDARLSDARPPAPGSTNYLQNTMAPQNAQLYLTGLGRFGAGASFDSNINITGGPSWTNFFWSAPIGLDNASAISWRPNAAGQRFGIGHSTSGASFFRTNNNPGETSQPAVTDLFISDAGRVGIGTVLPNHPLTVSGGQSWTDANWTASIGLNYASSIGWAAGPSTIRYGIGSGAGGLMFFRALADPGSAGATTSDVTYEHDGALRVGTLRIGDTYSSAASNPLCVGAGDNVRACSSSLRHKTNVQSSPKGLDVIRQLRPIRFDWISTGTPDLGFAAEEVEAVDPLLARRDPDGQVGGIQLPAILAVTVNAIKEQQLQIEQLTKENAELKGQMAAVFARLADLERRATTASAGRQN